MLTDRFDDIRPYYNEEINAAMNRIATAGPFPLLASYIYPDEPLEQVRERVRGYTNIRDFQHEVMYTVNQQVIDRSISQFSCNGLDQLSPESPCLYISNHRDIMLDSSLLQYFLVKNGFETSEITFGSNLMVNQFVIDIGKCNKMFKVERPSGSFKELYKSSLHLSDYIRHVITQKRESVWIAQRNGRTKDGNDQTDQGIVKMLCMSRNEDKIAAIGELNIVPVAVSYEWEPCDILKTQEVYQSRSIKYIKRPGEDVNSILTGLLQEKGKVHIEICRPISRLELEALDALTANEFHREVAFIISRRIIEAYRLMPTNYIAYDIRHGCTQFKDEYTPEQKQEFKSRIFSLHQYGDCEADAMEDIFLGIYSNPVESKIALSII